MNSIRQVPSRVKTKRTETNLGAEREHFDKQQLSSISKAINSNEAPVKEKHARRIILGTHREKGAFTFWSYALGLPLSSNSILSWKFCHVVHKVLRDGHHNVRPALCSIHSSTTGNLHDRYGQLVALYAKLLCTKMEFHVKVSLPSLALKLNSGPQSQFHCLNTSIAISTLTSGQCRLSPLIQVIQDCSHLYHFTVKLLFKLHACLPADTLQGHRDRFHDQFHSLKTFFNKARDMMYFKRLIQIPKLPESPPNFLHAASLAKHARPVVVIPDEDEPEQVDDEDDDPEPLINVSDVTVPSMAVPQVRLIGHRVMTSEGNGYGPLNINSLEAELEEQRVQKQRALVENEQLRMELEATRRRNAEHESVQATFGEAETRAQATEQRYNKLKEKHTELVSSHAELLRKVHLYEEPHSPFDHMKVSQTSKKYFLYPLFCYLPSSCLFSTLSLFLLPLSQVGEQQTRSMSALQAEKERLMHSVSEKEAALSALRHAAQLQQSSLQQERERSTRELGELQGRLQEKVSQDSTEQFSLLQGTVSEAESIIQDAVAKLDDPLHIRCTSSPGSIDKVKRGHSDYLTNMGDVGGLLRALTQFSHLAADTIINGSATAHMAPTDHADRLTENCRGCATHSLQFLKDLKSKASLQRADPASIRIVVQKILRLGEELRPKGVDVRQDELGDLVDKEMAATSAAIEEAVRRIDEMMNQARKDTSGVKLEVNERSVVCLTYSAIHLLVLTSTDLQKEIVEGGRGAATIKEFYARNSRWTEGLISASKAVGWGATQMVESADKVVLHTGKYEELIVCSHEIAASTAQLVASSKVKADRNSTKLTALQQASRRVNEMAANVVASTKTGQENLEDKDTMDFSGMSLIKLKMEEMESQVKVLELENQLGNERLRLGELRKKHYDIAGVPAAGLSEGNGLAPSSASEPSSPKPSKPSIMRKPALAQKPNLPPKNMVRAKMAGFVFMFRVVLAKETAT
uniref:Huntingtin-interacting protein 1-related protein n=1 Tax=Oncorhynchus mykiss TaxID=8022 RepID=A0A8C7PT13_ONCMY